jgi:hypothetical protein
LRDLSRIDDRPGRGAARADDQTGPVIRNLGFTQARIGNRLIHGDVGIGRAGGEEAGRAAVNKAFPINDRGGVNLTAETQFRIVGRSNDPRLGLLQGGQNLICIVSNRGDNTDTRYDDAAHMRILPMSEPLETHPYH